MNDIFFIQTFDDTHLDLYRECFSDVVWRHTFGVLDKDFKLNRHLQLVALTRYESVIRLISFKKEKALGFCNIEMVGSPPRRCFISGGVVPRLVGRGLGIRLACIAVDHIFSKFGLNKICCKVYSHNRTSFSLTMLS